MQVTKHFALPLLLPFLSPFIATAAAQCSGTGAGTCTLGLKGQLNGDFSQCTWEAATVYDNACNSLGGIANPVQGDAITSQLPATVVLTVLTTDGDYNAAQFCYNGQCYQGGFACSRVGDDGLENDCQHAFSC